MNFEDLQSEWQSQDRGISVKIDADLILNEVRRNHQTMERELWQRDLGEILAATIVAVAFTYFAVMIQQWTLLLCSIGATFVGLFFVIDRVKQHQRRLKFNQSLHSTVDASLAQIEHQIWLLKNVFWWGLLPLIPGVTAFLTSTSWQSRGNGLAEQMVIAVVGVICVIGFWSVYRINLREVKKTLEPRRMELEQLKESLNSPSFKK